MVPRYPDADGKLTGPPNRLGQIEALRLLTAAGGARFGVYDLHNPEGTPVYVHAKVCLVDDTWMACGSDNVNRRSWTHDSELSAAVYDESPDASYARDLRVALMSEHLGGGVTPAELAEPTEVFERLRASATALDAWSRGDRRAPRPPGRLRPLDDPTLSAVTRMWAKVAYRRVYDPDGRPRALRRRHSY